jgi:hypothetical protein
MFVLVGEPPWVRDDPTNHQRDRGVQDEALPPGSDKSPIDLVDWLAPGGREGGLAEPVPGALRAVRGG